MKYMELDKALWGRIYDENTPAFVSDGFISEDFQDKVIDFELKTIGTEKKLSRETVFDFSIVKGLKGK